MRALAALAALLAVTGCGSETPMNYSLGGPSATAALAGASAPEPEPLPQLQPARRHAQYWACRCGVETLGVIRSYARGMVCWDRNPHESIMAQRPPQEVSIGVECVCKLAHGNACSCETGAEDGGVEPVLENWTSNNNNTPTCYFPPSF